MILGDWCITWNDSCLYNFVYPLFSFCWHLVVSVFPRDLVVWKALTSLKCTSVDSEKMIRTASRNDSYHVLRSTHCSPQVEPHFLWDQCCQLRVQWGTFLLCVCGGSGWLLLTFGWPRTNISGLVSRGQCLQRRLLFYQHLLGLVWQRVRVAGWLLVVVVVGLLLCQCMNDYTVGAYILEVITASMHFCLGIKVVDLTKIKL